MGNQKLDQFFDHATAEDKWYQYWEEKGYFRFGGSMVILLFEPGKVQIDGDLLLNTARMLETEVKMGEGIARSVTE